MTQIGQMYEKEKIEYGNQRAKEAAREAAKEAAREVAKEMAKAMLDEDIDIVKVMKITRLTEDELLRLRDTTITV